MPMTQENRNAYEQAYTEYTNRDGRFRGADQRDIREVCAKARTWSAAPEWIGEDAVNTLILDADNDVADVNQGRISMHSERGGRGLMNAFGLCPFLCALLQQASSVQTITRDQYLRWQRGFFDLVGFRAKVVFNRLIFTCFPTQFCSVVLAKRLRDVMKELVRQGLLDAYEVTEDDDAEWFDLCQHVVPVIRAAFPTRDYADHSTFLAAMGEALTKK